MLLISECECSGQADLCNQSTGACYCNTRGVIGDRCTEYVDELFLTLQYFFFTWHERFVISCLLLVFTVHWVRIAAAEMLRNLNSLTVGFFVYVHRVCWSWRLKCRLFK
jgi:hypothetical protein